MATPRLSRKKRSKSSSDLTSTNRVAAGAGPHSNTPGHQRSRVVAVQLAPAEPPPLAGPPLAPVAIDAPPAPAPQLISGQLAQALMLERRMRAGRTVHAPPPASSSSPSGSSRPSARPVSTPVPERKDSEQKQPEQKGPPRVAPAELASLIHSLRGRTAMLRLREGSREELALWDEFIQAAASPDPLMAYHRDGANSLTCESFRRTSDEEKDNSHGLVTARSLLLTRGVEIPWSNKDSRLYGTDTYESTLGLNAGLLDRWRGRRVLDLGAGNALFAAEARAIHGVDVVPVDLNASTSDQLKAQILDIYFKNLLFADFLAGYLRLSGRPIPDALMHMIMDPELLGIRANAREIATAYHADGMPEKGDATKLWYEPDTFDHSVSSWLFLYFSPAQQQAALSEMLRVTREGGEIRVFEGASLFGRHESILQNDSIIASIGEAFGKRLVRVPTPPDADSGAHHLGSVNIFRVVRRGWLW